MASNCVGESLPLSSPVTECKGVGPKTAVALQRLGIATLEHLIYHLPRSYLDRRKVFKIGSIEPPGQFVIQGEISGIRSFRRSGRRHITQCVVRDGTGSIKAVWFNQPYMGRSLPKGAEAIFSGNVVDRNGLQMTNPDVEVLSGKEKDILHTLALIPLYPLTRGVGQKKMRRLLWTALDAFLDSAPENLPREIIESERLMPRREALRTMHFPQSEADPDAARRRIAFEEFLALQLCIQASSPPDSETGIAQNAPRHVTDKFETQLPFDLTKAQQTAIAQISTLMESQTQMNALLQGDVGTGKTMVAVYAMLKAIENGKQAVLMAPTEILAEQHAAGISKHMRTLLEENAIQVALLTGSRPPDEKKHAMELLASGRPALIIGTHSLIGRSIEMPNAGLIVIDEQHRFGVGQRAMLKAKGIDADLLIMTATPIPRTLALAFYGNFQTIAINEYPAGRHPVETRHVGDNKREGMYRALGRIVKKGRQAFVVCPEIDTRSEPGDRPLASLNRMRREYTKRFPELCIELMHGRLSPEEREAVLDRFRGGEINMLIATIIIEVGVDVPNAGVIVIEDADRFGLAQLHQLRGRVGRSSHKSYCFLAGEPTTEKAARRIEIMTSTCDGFEISEQDLLLRGPGEFLGSAQSGVPPLRVGHLILDADLLERARDVAQELVRNDIGLQSAKNKPLHFLLGGKLGEVHY